MHFSSRSRAFHAPNRKSSRSCRSGRPESGSTFFLVEVEIHAKSIVTSQKNGLVDNLIIPEEADAPMPRMFVTPQGKNLMQVRKLGRGQFGIADLVQDRRYENFCLKQVAVRTSDEDAKAEVMKEVELMKMSVHPNIVVLHDSWFDKNRLYILMEYCVNSSVDHLIAEYSSKIFFTEDKVVSFVAELSSSALTYLHGIFASCTGTSSRPTSSWTASEHSRSGILDFQSVLEERICVPALLVLLCTCHRNLCMGNSYSFKTDVWALGCIAYEFMVLKSPWLVGCSSYPALVRNITGSTPSYASLRKRYSEPLVNSVRWMLQKA